MGRSRMGNPGPEFPGDERLPDTFGEALAGIVNHDYCNSQAWQAQQLRANRHGVHPDILEFERVFVRRCTRLGIPLFASEVMRSAKRQDELHALGHSRARGGQSPHQWGCAIDLVHAIKGWNLAPMQWKLLAHIGKEVIAQKGLSISSMAWGGDWTFYDPAHWQIENWKAIRDDYPAWPDVKRYRWDKRNGRAI